MADSESYEQSVINGLISTTGLPELNLTDGEVKAFGSALAWHLGGSKENVSAVVTRAGVGAGVLSAHWIAGDAVGFLMIKKGSDSAPTITGWLRPLASINLIDFVTDVKTDSYGTETDVRPGVVLHFAGDGTTTAVTSQSLSTEKELRRVRDFVSVVRDSFTGKRDANG